MIKYKSTRGSKELYTFSEVILKGISEDGGLFVPEQIPQITLKNLQSLVTSSYQEKATFIINLFQPDFPESIVKNIVNKAYSSNFDNKEIVPIIKLKGTQYIMELWHGPTAAFKDMALQIMPHFFLESVKKNNLERQSNKMNPLRYLILVATSGDTGKAALEGYKDLENISIIVLYPDGHVSELQELQMQTQEGKNVSVYAIDGDFDDAQSLVKDIFNDKRFNQKLESELSTLLSSANSINWGRLLPQIVYHIHGYLELVRIGAIAMGQEIEIAVPTGNFGNILAAYYAKKIGLPIKKLICASNENNVLTDFLKTGVYDIQNRKLVQTPSPSMDILISSNTERLLFLITNDTKKVALWMQDLKVNGKFEVDATTKEILQTEFHSDWVKNYDCLHSIKKVYDETSDLVDPHTSVAQLVADRHLNEKNTSSTVLVCSTAHWAKFAKDMYKALINNSDSKIVDEFEILDLIHKFDPKLFIPKSISELRNKKIRHQEKCSAKLMLVEGKIMDFIKNFN